jgi:undecaprenyl-diphosphatase
MITWIPFYLLILLLVFRKYNQYGFWVLLALAVSIVLSDQLSGLFKELVGRYRPSHEPLLVGKVHLPMGPGGEFGFVSSHAANTFAFAFLIGKLSKNNKLFLLLFGWALVTGYSRIYVGVHYPLDVVAGAVLGGLIGWSMYKLLMYADGHYQRKKIFYAGKWKDEEVQPALMAMLFIVATFLMVSPVIGKFFIQP